MTRMLPIAAAFIAVLNLSAMAAPKQNFGPTQAQAVPVAFDGDQSHVLERKAQKYGINPNLLCAALSVEVQRLESKRWAKDPQVFEWMAEQAARVLRHVSEKADDPYSVFKYYAAGEFFVDSQTKRHREAIRFASQADALFRRLEKAHPWRGQ